MRTAAVLSVCGALLLGAVLIDLAHEVSAGSLYYHLDEEYRAIDREVDGQPTYAQLADVGPIPFDATAVSYKISVSDPPVHGHVTFAPGTSVLNFAPGETSMNAGVTEVQSLGVLISASARVRVTIDIVGYFRLAE